jgi:predicted metalloprotease with PDZ domain
VKTVLKRITKAHIDKELHRLVRTAERLNLKPREETWAVIRGSVQDKEPWCLVVVDRRGGQTWVDFLPQGVIGNNATEVYNNIKTFCLAWDYFLEKGK